MNKPQKFSAEVIGKLRYYVYRLIDPRNGETFYVGKGKGNRVFSHVNEEVTEDQLGNKLQRIREIRLAGFEVGHVIHRHGLDEKAAMEVEAALIDAFPGLTNSVGGNGAGEFGSMHAMEIVRKYSAAPAKFKHKALLISINRTAATRSTYEATRFAWKINRNKAAQAEVILATSQGIIMDVFVAHRWLEATAANFPGHDDAPGRFGFEGNDAPPDVKALYVGKRVPDEFRKQGAANPVKYSWKP